MTSPNRTPIEVAPGVRLERDHNGGRRYSGTAAALVSAGICPAECLPSPTDRDTRGRRVRHRNSCVGGRDVGVRERGSSGVFFVYFAPTAAERVRACESDEIESAKDRATRDARMLAGITEAKRRWLAGESAKRQLVGLLATLGEPFAGFRYATAEVERIGRAIAEILDTIEHGELWYSSADLETEQRWIASHYEQKARGIVAKNDRTFQAMLEQCGRLRLEDLAGDAGQSSGEHGGGPRS